MTLRNAFSDLALDASIQALTASVDALAGLTMKLIRSQQGERVLPYARTTTDQLRVNVDSGSINSLLAITWGNNNGYPVWYATGAPNSIDQRELLREQSKMNARMVRNGRWTFS